MANLKCLINSSGYILVAVENYWRKSELWGFEKINRLEGRKVWGTCSQVKNEAETSEFTKDC